MALIEQEALIQAIEDLKGNCDSRFYDEAIVDCVSEAVSAPTIDAAPVVHGRWKYFHKQNRAVCTNCSFERNLDLNLGRAISCPNCGCKMDGGEGHEAN